MDFVDDVNVDDEETCCYDDKRQEPPEVVHNRQFKGWPFKYGGGQNGDTNIPNRQPQSSSIQLKLFQRIIMTA